jgi:transposase
VSLSLWVQSISGLDVHRDSISVGVLRSEEVSPDVEKIFHDEASVRRLIDRFGDRGALRVCYEAGPTGFGLHRLLASMGWPVWWWRRR